MCHTSLEIVAMQWSNTDKDQGFADPLNSVRFGSAWLGLNSVNYYTYPLGNLSYWY